MQVCNIISQWFDSNKLEAIASIIGLINIYFGIKEKALFWIIGLATSSMFFVLYLQNRLYAYMMLQTYYFGLGVFGIYYWMKGDKKSQDKVHISNISLKNAIFLTIIFAILFTSLYYVLDMFTNSNVPLIDALVSSSAIIAAYMLVRKYIENWIVWIISDIITMYLLWYKGLYAALVLQSFYFVFAFVGYFQWKKTLLELKTKHQTK